MTLRGILRAKGLRFCFVVLAIGSVAEEGLAAEKDPKAMYQVEVLFRNEGVLFLGRQSLPAAEKGNSRLRAVGFTAKGKVVHPPDPGYDRIIQVTKNVERVGDPKPPPPLALTTHYYRGHLGKSGGLSVFVSDMGTGVLAPSNKPGSAILIVFNDCLFRIERVKAAPEPMRQDHAYWKKRSAELLHEAQASKDTSIRKWFDKQAKPRP